MILAAGRRANLYSTIPMGGIYGGESKLSNAAPVSWLRAVTGRVLLVVRSDWQITYWAFFLDQECIQKRSPIKSQIFNLRSKFRKGRENAENIERVGRPSTVKADTNVTKVRNLLDTDSPLTLRVSAKYLGMSLISVGKIAMEGLCMRKIWLTQIIVARLPQSPYSPSLSLVDFFLFPILKTPLKETRLEDVASIQSAVTKTVKDISETHFQGAFNAWKSR